MNTTKKLITLLLAFMFANVAIAYDFKIDGIYYVINEKNATATVTNYSNGPIGFWGTEYSGDIVIPESITTESGKTYTVTAIGDYAFASCNEVTSILLPNTILSFGDHAFSNCNGLTTLSIPNSLVAVGEECFGSCMGLTELTFPETLRSIGNSAFYLCRNLANIHIPNSLTSIGQEVFSYTAWLDNQPDGVIYAGPFAYSYKGELAEGTVEIKPGTRYIADNAFINCPTLTRVYMPNSITAIGIRSFHSCSKLEYVELPDSLVAVGFQAFSGCSKIQSFDFPSTLKSVGISAFSGTAWYDNQPDGLVYTGSVAYHYKGRIPEGTDYVIPDGTISLGDGLFSEDELYSPNDDYEGLLSVSIPNSVKYMGDYVFYDCYPNLSKISIGIGVEEMGKSSLACILNLTEVNISEGVKLIGEQMLSGCGNLKDIKIPNSVEVIKYRAFAAEEYDGHIDNNPCELLAQVTIGSGVKSIEEYAFSGCQALEKITCLATTPPVMKDENCFDEECYSDATLFVPTEVIDVYASNTTWGRFMHIQPIVSDDVPGDVNGDGEVTVADANNVVDIVVMGGNSGHSRAPQADVNGDNEVNIADVNAIVDIILGDGTSIPSGFETITVNGVSFNMVKVEGGTFTMGAGDDDTEATEWERPAHMVTLSSFYIGQTEVTQALWQAVMGANPSWYSSRKGFEENLRRPVECVSWDDCMTFIETLNQMTGKQFRLPTEAEWEYAARGGNKSQGYRYSGSNTIGDVTWYYENSNDIMHPVATKSPNELGLFDMSGNVWEWCQDWLGEYSGSAQANPTGPISGTVRLMRGGSSSFDAIDCRVSNRDAYNPLEAIYDLGLRLVLDHDAD